MNSVHKLKGNKLLIIYTGSDLVISKTAVKVVLKYVKFLWILNFIGTEIEAIVYFSGY